MARGHVSAHIRAPVERVFAYLQEPAHVPVVWPSIVAVDDIERLPDGRVSYRWTYRLGPLRLRGVSEDVEVAPHRLVVSHTRDGAESHWTWRFDPEDGGTRVTMEFGYHWPLPVIGDLVERLLVRRGEREIERLLSNVDAILTG